MSLDQDTSAFGTKMKYSERNPEGKEDKAQVDSCLGQMSLGHSD